MSRAAGGRSADLAHLSGHGHRGWIEVDFVESESGVTMTITHYLYNAFLI